MEYFPQYTITNKTLKNLLEINKLVFELNLKKIPNPAYVKMLNTSQHAFEIHKLRKKPFDINLVSKFYLPSTDPHNKKYSPPIEKDYKKFLKNLLQYINKNLSESDIIILSAIFHKQYYLLQPSEEGIQTSFLLTRILLSKMDFHFFNLLQINTEYNKNPKNYINSIGEIGNFYAINHKIDLTQWIEYFTQNLLEEVKALKRSVDRQKNSTQTKITKDQEKILNYLMKNETITDHEYSQFTKRKKSTRVVDFNNLIKANMIERKGKARQTYYILKS